MQNVDSILDRDQLKMYGVINAQERDINLSLNGAWPVEIPGWSVGSNLDSNKSYLFRPLQLKDPSQSSGETNSLSEFVIRFPSAPLYSTHRRYEYQYNIARLNYHTFRLLRRPWKGPKPSQIEKIFIIHNGLNECEYFDFYYELAERLILDDKTACIVRPIPGHLNRYPFSSPFSQKPLESYLADAGNLFRQFLRYMIETQWLLSAIVPMNRYHVVAGLALLEPGDEKKLGRWDPKTLSKRIFSEFNKLYKANNLPKGESHPPPTFEEFFGKSVTREAILDSIICIRHLLGWKQGQSPKKPPQAESLCPSIHAIGYSLGGFLAQSVFFSWPFAIGSCTTLCAGGALRDVGITAFAHPEEWQMVVRALRFEMGDAMIQGRIKLGPQGTIAGLNQFKFSFLEKIFYDVFLQDDRGTYKSRVFEFVNRLFFVIGGNDPIVTAQSVLNASPPGGVNLLEISSLSHFLRSQTLVVEEWRDFWLPEVTRIINFFSGRANKLHGRTLYQNWWDDNWDERMKINEAPNENTLSQSKNDSVDIHLSSETFQFEIEDMVNRLDSGWLFILRNDVPAVLLNTIMLHRRSVAVHFADDAISNYVSRLQSWQKKLRKEGHSVSLVVPAKLPKWFKSYIPTLSPMQESILGTYLSTEKMEEIWGEFNQTWSSPPNSLKFFRGGGEAVNQDFEKKVRGLFKGVSGSDKLVVNTLPDVWLFLSNLVRERWLEEEGSRPTGDDRKVMEKKFIDWAGKLAEKDVATVNLSKQWLSSRDICLVKFSAAEFNPRFRGTLIHDFEKARRYIIHAALAFTRSEEIS